jgi:predicted O-methyltransferase YrrM
MRNEMREAGRGMNILRRFLRLEDPKPTSSSVAVQVRPLEPIATPTGRPENITQVMATPAYAEVVRYFSSYPGRSLMSDHSRAVLYSLVRLMRPKLVAEIGTLYAGTTEVFARALWQNGEGVVHTVDPYGIERCPAVIVQWPVELQRHTQYHAKSSMDFFSRMVLEGKRFDLLLIDGNHDYEYAFFDLQMAARLVTPGGIVVMDNAEQTGPFRASRTFLKDNPAWREIGGAIVGYDPLKPFDRARASLPDTTFLLLQAPDHLSIGTGPHSWGQDWITIPSVSGLHFDIVVPCRGTLFYQVHLRGFANANRWTSEDRLEGSLRLDFEQSGRQIDHRFDRTMTVAAPAEYGDALFTLELDLSWQADPGSPPLALARLPEALDG